MLYCTSCAEKRMLFRFFVLLHGVDTKTPPTKKKQLEEGPFLRHASIEG